MSVTRVPPVVGANFRLIWGLTGPKAASKSILRFGSTAVTRVVCPRTFPITGCPILNMVPTPSGPPVVLTTDSKGRVRADDAPLQIQEEGVDGLDRSTDLDHRLHRHIPHLVLPVRSWCAGR